jgi:SAM-dependent methyltransferase
VLDRILLPARVLLHTLRRRGVRATIGLVVRSVRSWGVDRRRTAADRAFDRQHGVETASWVRRVDLVTESPNQPYAGRYQASGVAEFEELMGKLDIDHAQFSFVDYGCGKGKVLLLAAAYPFKRIVGVEFSPPLARIAAENVATLGDDAERVETIVADATEYAPPPEPLVLYFFNPFSAPVLRGVLARVEESLAASPRPVYIVLDATPELAEVVEAAGYASGDVDRTRWRIRGVFVREG